MSMMVERSLPLGDLTVSGGDGRTVVARLLTYGREYRVSDNGADWYNEKWRSGAFRRFISHWETARERIIPLAYEHDGPGHARSLPVGKGLRAWEDGDAVMMEGRIARTSTGDDLVELLRDEVIRGVSVVAVVHEHAPMVGGREYLQGALRAVAFTTAPQYGDAELIAMRSEPEEVLSPERPRLLAVTQRLDSLPPLELA
jgi:HK97 family phage prohead protease